MTVKELIKELQKMPEDAIVLGDTYLNQECIIDTVEYDEETNTVSFYGMEIFKEPDIPDDVDETNYDPYCGCDMFEICGSIDEEW